jgi:hypothetical protein
MVNVRLSDNSSIGRLTIRGTEGMSEITRNDSTPVTVLWAIVRVNDPDLFFTFEEADGKIIKGLTGNLLTTALREARVETAEELHALLIPKKKKTTSKPKAKKTTSTKKND